jgi:hypothetical protein
LKSELNNHTEFDLAHNTIRVKSYLFKALRFVQLKILCLKMSHVFLQEEQLFIMEIKIFSIIKKDILYLKINL